ncbi:MAG TPA: Uma2 family endonuclease [Blastocatellia bacterium]|nr:Uma2 family endonuclease [Blastocatellia bacterium]
MSALQEPVSDLLFTIDDLSAMPDDGKRYEIIEGELYVSTQPNWHHQYACSRLVWALENWGEQTGLGVANGAPGVIFSIHDAVAPDVVWVSYERLPHVLGEDGKLHAAPDLVVEVVSPGRQNEHRDRDIKLRLYSRRAVREYWIVDWQTRQVEVYRRNQMKLTHTATLLHEDELTSPLLPGFSCKVSTLFMQIPPAPKA